MAKDRDVIAWEQQQAACRVRIRRHRKNLRLVMSII